MSRTLRQWFGIAGVVALLVACGGPTATTAPGPSPATAGPPVSRTTATFAPGPCPTPNVPGVPQLDLGPDFSCGYLTVPENRARPDGPAIRVGVARVKAVSPTARPDPIVWLTGGPGGTAIATANLTVAKGINADRDIIFVDQRGTLHAQPALVCPEIDAFQRDALGLPITDPATAAKSDAATRACRDRLAGQGIDLAGFDTTQNTADLADLRIALGIEQWNVRGVSYGTDLALQLLRDHPQGIRSVVLDSVFPPQTNLIDGLWPNAAAGYQALFDACAAQPTCAATYPDLRAEFTATVRRLAQQPLTAQLPNPAGGPALSVMLDGYKVANLLNVLALNPGSLTGAPAMLHALAIGDPVPAARALLQTISPPGLNGFGLQFGVVCREHTAFSDPAKMQAEAKRALPDIPDRVLAAPPQVPRIFPDCGIWNTGRADPAAGQPTSSVVPVLLLGGTLDGITPPGWAETAAASLTNSKVLLFPGAGHDVIQWNNCAVPVMLSFLDDPIGDYDTSCVEQLAVPPFATPA
jgi:pimeloyl-ACP methyl ester carboxylesterase